MSMKEGINSLGSVSSKVGIWAPVCSLLIQEARSNRLRLPPLPSKSCSYCNHGRRCFKTLLWGQTNYFYQPPSKTTPKWERPFMDATTDWFQIGKGVHQGCIVSSCLFNVYAEYLMRNGGLEEVQAGFRRCRGTRNQIANIHQIIEKAREFQKNI